MEETVELTEKKVRKKAEIPKERRKKKLEMVFTIGKRKRAIARATAKPGTGKIYINGKFLDYVQPEPVRLYISEPILIAGDVSKTLDININVQGGGIFGQAAASRQAIAKAMVEFESSLKQKFLDYDRTLLVADARRTEPHKPSRSKQGPRRHKQRSKR